MFVSREYIKYCVFWHGLLKILSSVYRTWSLKEQCVISCTYRLIAVITSSPLSLGNHNELGKSTILFAIYVGFNIECLQNRITTFHIFLQKSVKSTFKEALFYVNTIIFISQGLGKKTETNPTTATQPSWKDTGGDQGREEVTSSLTWWDKA